MRLQLQPADMAQNCRIAKPLKFQLLAVRVKLMMPWNRLRPMLFPMLFVMLYSLFSTIAKDARRPRSGVEQVASNSVRCYSRSIAMAKTPAVKAGNKASASASKAEASGSELTNTKIKKTGGRRRAGGVQAGKTKPRPKQPVRITESAGPSETPPGPDKPVGTEKANVVDASDMNRLAEAIRHVQESIDRISSNTEGGCPCLLQQAVDPASQTEPGQKANQHDDGAKDDKPDHSDQNGDASKSNDPPEFTYPTDAVSKIDTDPCGTFEALHRYWSYSRLVDFETPVWINSSDWIPIEQAFDAINCVTEAISRVEGQESFAIWTEAAWNMWRAYRIDRTAAQPDDFRVGRSGSHNRWLVPFWIPLMKDKATSKAVEHRMLRQNNDRGHTVLLEFKLHSNPKSGAKPEPRFVMYDSLAINKKGDREFGKHENIYSRIADELTSICQWGTIGAWADVQNVAVQPQQGAPCTLHAVLNAWTRALDLEPNTEFRADRQFYDQALRLVNLASAGHLDSATLFAWLMCSRIAQEGTRYEDVKNKFAATWPARNNSTFERLRRDLAGAVAIDDGSVEARRPSAEIAEAAEIDLGHPSMAELRSVLNSPLLNVQLLRDEDLPQVYEYLRQGRLDRRIRRRIQASIHKLARTRVES